MIKEIDVMLTAEQQDQIFKDMLLKRTDSKHVGNIGDRCIVICRLMYSTAFPMDGADSKDPHNRRNEFMLLDGSVLRYDGALPGLPTMRSGDWYTLDCMIVSHSPDKVEHRGRTHIIKYKHTRIAIIAAKHAPAFSTPFATPY